MLAVAATMTWKSNITVMKTYSIYTGSETFAISSYLGRHVDCRVYI